MAKRIADATEGPIGSEAQVGWAKYADGGTWQLFRAGHEPDGDEPDFYQDPERARGAFLSWASRHGYTVSAPMVYPEDGSAPVSFKITARKRTDAPMKATG